MILVVRALAFPRVAVLGQVGEEDDFRDLVRNPAARCIPGLIIYRFEAPVFFANASVFRSRLEALVSASPEAVNWVLVDAAACVDTDVTACDLFIELDQELREKGVRLVIAEAIGPLREVLLRGGVTAKIGEDAIFPTIGVAVKAYRASFTLQDKRNQ